MRRYLIMLSALFVAIIVMTLIKSWQRRRALARGEDPEAINGITIAHLIGALAGLTVFFLGVFLCLTERCFKFVNRSLEIVLFFNEFFDLHLEMIHFLFESLDRFSKVREG